MKKQVLIFLHILVRFFSATMLIKSVALTGYYNIAKLHLQYKYLKIRELEEQKIVLRNVFPEVPPRVEYSLSEIGITLKPVLGELCKWGKIYQEYQRK